MCCSKTTTTRPIRRRSLSEFHPFLLLQRDLRRATWMPRARCYARRSRPSSALEFVSFRCKTRRSARCCQTRRCVAALRVLALKGTTREHLCAELTSALGTLAAQGEAFARKLRERRDALTQSGQSESQRCSDQTGEAERAITRLQSELDALRTTIREAEARRDQQ